MSEKQETTKSAEVIEAKFTVSELCEHALALFGKQKEVVIGALHHVYQSDQGTYTKKEVQRAIEKFLKKEAN